MAGYEQTSLQVEFAIGVSGKVVMERSGREPEENDEVFFRVHGGGGHTILSTSGVVGKADSGLFRFTSEFLNFSGQATTELSYPNAANVKLTQFGGALGIDGLPVQITPYYDAANNVISTGDVPVYCSILVEYDAPYDMWRAIFAGKCPSVESMDPPQSGNGGSPDDDRPYEGRDPMVVIARRAGVVSASLVLEPPPCIFDEEDRAFFASNQMGATEGELVIEVDIDNPIDFVGGSKKRLEAGCKINVYPASLALQVGVTNGVLYANTKVEQIRKVTETVSFSGDSSANLSYPPLNNNISVKVIDKTFVDYWGRTFEPTIKVWGTSITSVEWVSKNTTRNPIRRRLYRREIAVANLFNDAIPSSGSVEVSYVTKRYQYRYEFAYDDKIKEFKDAFAIAALGKQSASLPLAAPSRTGRR